MTTTPTPLQDSVAQLVHPYRGEEHTRAIRMLAEEVGKVERQRDQLEEQVKRFTEVLSDPVSVWANMLRGTIAMPQHIPELERRLTHAHALVERFQKAGQDAIDYIDGKHRDAGRVLDGWRKANQ